MKVAKAQPSTAHFVPDQMILIVDHYRVGQRIVVMQLQHFGLNAHVVNSCRQAVRAVKARHYDLILIGCGMPACDGVACIKFVRRQDLRRDETTTVVAVMAHANPGDRPRCIGLGMDDLISKPITMFDMQALLQRHLRAA